MNRVLAVLKIIVDITRSMQFSSSVVLALALLVGNAAAYGGSFMGARSALSSGRAASGRAAMRMEVRARVHTRDRGRNTE